MISDTAALARSFFALVPSPIPPNLLAEYRGALSPLGFTRGMFPGSDVAPETHYRMTCRDWMNLSRFGKLNLVGNVWGMSRFGMSRDQIAAGIDAYCLQQAVQEQNRPRSSSPSRTPIRSAGEVSLPSGGAQWGGLAFITAMFGLFYWGLRAESPEEKLAYDRMKAARHNPHAQYRIDTRGDDRVWMHGRRKYNDLRDAVKAASSKLRAVGDSLFDIEIIDNNERTVWSGKDYYRARGRGQW